MDGLCTLNLFGFLTYFFKCYLGDKSITWLLSGRFNSIVCLLRARLDFLTSWSIIGAAFTNKVGLLLSIFFFFYAGSPDSYAVIVYFLARSFNDSTIRLSCFFSSSYFRSWNFNASLKASSMSIFFFGFSTSVSLDFYSLSSSATTYCKKLFCWIKLACFLNSYFRSCSLCCLSIFFCNLVLFNYIYSCNF